MSVLIKIALSILLKKVICLKTKQQTHNYYNFIVILSALMGKFLKPLPH